MLVKDLYKKYDKDYTIMLFGRPLDENTIPFTLLPKGKNLNECEVVEYRVIDKKHETYILIKKEKENIKGYVYAYIK